MISSYLRRLNHKSWILIFTLFFSFIIYAGIVLPSGHYSCYEDGCGRYYNWVHAHDAMWHLAVANTAFTAFPPVSPIFHGLSLSGYNYLYDLFLSLVSQTGLDSSLLYFKISPVIWFISFAILFCKLVFKFHQSSVFLAINLFVLFFISHFGYIFQYLNSQTIIGSSGVLSTQVVHLGSNPPFAYSLLLLLLTLIILRKNKHSIRITLLLALYSALAFGLKFYGGFACSMLAFLYIAFAPTTSFLLRLSRLLMFSSIVIASIILWYAPFAGGSPATSVFSFDPLATVHPITEDTNRFYQRELTDARYFLQAHGIGPRLIAIEIVNISLYLFFNYGLRLLGLGYLIFLVIKNHSRFDIIIFVSVSTLMLIPMLFVQRGEWWNISQFAEYAVFILTFYTALLIYRLNQKFKLPVFVMTIIILLLGSVNSLDVLYQSFLKKVTNHIPQSELLVLAHLRQLPPGVVGDDLWRSQDSNSSAYVAAFGKHPLYFSNTYQQRVMGVDYRPRKNELLADPCKLFSEVDYYYSNNLEQVDKLYSACVDYSLSQIYTQANSALYKVIPR